MRFLLLVFVACGLAVVACERSSPVEPLVPICAMGTAVTVGAGVQPTISWTGGCRVTEVRVEAYPVSGAGPLEIAWQARSPSNDVVSPIQVGVPHASGSYGPKLRLISGRVYRACLVRWDDTTSEPIDLECQTFTP